MSSLSMTPEQINCGRAEYVYRLVMENHSDEVIHTKLRELDQARAPRWKYWYTRFNYANK